MPTIEERLAALEARTLADTVTPNYLTIDPATGRVSANFTGVVHALGLNLDAPVLGVGLLPAKTNEVYWDNPDVTGGSVDGAISSALRPSPVPTRGEMEFRQLSPDGTIVEMFLQARDAGSGNSLIQISAGAASIPLLDSAGQSGFLQLASLADHSIAFGSGTFNFTAGSNLSNVITVNHGLGVVPVIVIGAIEGSAAGTLALSFMPVAGSFTTAQFQCIGKANANFGANASNNFYWLAIG